ncbi:OmpA family protein [Celeribacter persicus]|uniref:Outer membrane protein OmpA-like peptidoglycan-associated protein n=1 Tax=Celeribacter persicus TaxID=1651082 RepID=A0A2T5HTM9_9RHOB|nr:OmpA family protein [Celeribacter persicus]PTQ74848.1 outer membrane protein OmpA-like peptidoglycan-associated protein [Celeribacter persicus]
MIRPVSFAFSLTLATGAWALDLPGVATQTGRSEELSSAQPFPRGAFQGEATPDVMAEGDIELVAYRLNGTSLTSYQMIDPLRAQLEQDGFNTLYSCADMECGGFDFRYLLDLLPEPAMHVDLGDFQYLLSEHPDGRVVSVLSSKARDAGYIQISTVTPSDEPEVELRAPSAPEAVVSLSGSEDLINRLETRGRVVLEDLTFETGASNLGEGPFASLRRVAEYLKTHPEVRLALVGHTDNVGGLDGNTALSRKRAESVRQRLIQNYGIAPGQISAEGIGYLAPRTSNATEEGREKNRRVEAVITSTQ